MEAASSMSAAWCYDTQHETVDSGNANETITYSLKGDSQDSEAYYRDVALFTDRVLSEAELSLLPLVRDFKDYLRENQIESLRSDEEYELELMTLGVLWMSYAPHVKRFSPLVSGLFHALINLRQRGGWLKPKIDALRGVLATLFLVPAKLREGVFLEYTPENFVRFLSWLSVTGEFKEEVKRLHNWQQYFEGLSREEMTTYLHAAHSFARWFASRSRTALGKYTRNVSSFLAEEHPRRYRWREDMIFCGRKEVEYHLIMLGAEIMNRAFREEIPPNSEKSRVAAGLHADETR